QTITGNGNTVTYSGRDTIINGQTLKENEGDLQNLIEKALKELTLSDISDDDKDNIVEDLEDLKKEINSEEPMERKFKKIKRNIDIAISETDSTLKKSVGLI
ncbi:DUF2321 domain-containing protein, partial [Paeniclostridium sordellii]|uniref:DUF2321 domain-containing protein n=1 Tax=Paraclostridium sordellii TaxID=1505 RepID=UPI00210C8EB7